MSPITVVHIADGGITPWVLTFEVKSRHDRTGYRSQQAPASPPPAEVISGWPYLNRGGEEGDGAEPGEPALYGGLGHHRPFG